MEDKKKEKERRILEINLLVRPNSLYFSHPINIYDTDLERFLLKNIRDSFPDYNLENPNQKHHQENYKFWKENFGSGMKYYFEEILPRMKAGIGLPFEDGTYGAGVFGELKYLSERGKPIWEINSGGAIKKIENLDESLALSVEETKKRVYQ